MAWDTLSGAFLLVIICIGLLTTANGAQVGGKDEPEILLDLKKSAEPVHDSVQLKPHSEIEFRATNIAPSSTFLLFQCHCQKDNVTIRYGKEPTFDSAVHGTSVGLVSYLKNQDTQASVWLANNNTKELSCFVAVTPHHQHDPVPGGCNVEFNVPTSPFIHLTVNAVQTILEYQNANLGYKRSSQVQPNCDSSLYYVSYEFYVMFLEEGNYDISQYVQGLSHSLTWSSLESEARNLKPYVKAPAKRLFFSSFPGQGVIYNIVAKYTAKVNASNVVYHSPYVPFVTYGCSFSDEIDGCYSINRIFTYVFCICAAVVGLLLCFAGHHFFKIEMLVAGFLAASLLTFILVLKYTTWSHTDREILTMVCGAIGGLLWLALWWFLGMPLLSVLLVGFELGYLLSCIIMFTPLGDLDIFRNNFDYWMTFAIAVIFVPVILLYFTKQLSIIFCSVIGSFGIIVAIDRYIRTTLSYIILNVVKRSIYGSMDRVNKVLPFQTNDIILCVAWTVLAVLGIVVQNIITKNKSPFPECPYQKWKGRGSASTTHQSRNRVRQLRNVSENEVDPLLDEDRNVGSRAYGSVD